MSGRQQYAAVIEVERGEQVDELVRLAADAEIGLSVYTHREPCTCDSAHGCGACFADAQALIGFTVRSRSTGRTFVVTHTDARDRYPTVEGDGCSAMFDAIVVIAPPKGDDPR